MYNIGILDVMFSFLSDASHSLRKYNSTLIQNVVLPKKKQ